jgi:UDP-N-acetylmuramoyl-L-alanyl-D-glutamate--2,6-diaminopimelate ligase
VICVDDETGRRIANETVVPVTTCSVGEALDLQVAADGSRFTWRGHQVRLRLAGRFNVANAVVAATMASVLGLSDELVAEGLGAVVAVAGRFERVEAGQPFVVVVDFAHTPDALAQALAAARELSAGRTIVVFGCGGERDVAKRPAMGAMAAVGADVVVLTADNSRSEATEDIIEAILVGVRSVPGAADRCMVEPDRRAAIDQAFGSATAGDVVLIAGRGHEALLSVGPLTEAFDDRQVAAELLMARGWAA